MSIEGYTQPKKNRVFVGGEMGWSLVYGSKQYGTSMIFKFMPSVGYMISNKVGVQLSLGYSNFGSDFNSYENHSQTKFNNAYFAVIGIPIFFSLSEKLSIYIMPSLQVLNQNTVSYTDYSTIASAGILPGIIYFPYKKVSLNFSLGNIFSASYSIKNKDGSLDLFNFSSTMPTLGVSLWFGKI